MNYPGDRKLMVSLNGYYYRKTIKKKREIDVFRDCKYKENRENF